MKRTKSMSSMSPWMAVPLAIAAVAAAGCLDLIGYRDHVVGDPFATGGGGTGGTTTTSDTGGGGTGGTGGGTTCEPGSMVSCYSGPPGTENEGICKAGTQTCNEDGSGYGQCANEVLPLPETCGTMTDDDCDGTDCALWSTIWGDAGDPVTVDLAVDPDGNLVVFGMLGGSMTIEGQVLEVNTSIARPFLVKLDKDGKLLWAKILSDEGTTQIGAHMVLDPEGNILLAGDFGGALTFGKDALTSVGAPDIFVAKLDPNGEQVWARSFGSSGAEFVGDLAVDPLGDPIVVGWFASNFNIEAADLVNAGGLDMFVAKVAGGIGQVLWAKGYGDTGNQSAIRVACDESGDLVFIGLNDGTIDFGGAEVTDETPDNADMFVAKLSGINGAHIWSVDYTTDGSVSPDGVAAGPGGDFVAFGSFSEAIEVGGEPLASAGQSDAFLAKLSSSGEHAWVKRLGGSSFDVVNTLAFDDRGSIFLGVTGAGTIDFGGGPVFSAGDADVFLAKLDGAGEHVWSRRFGDAGQQHLPVIAVTPGALYLACDVDGSVDFGNGPLMGTGKTDTAVARLGP